MVNALEDLRIERCSVKEWPGTEKLLKAMWTHVITDRWSGGPDPDNLPRTLVFYVLLRIRQREWDLDVQRPLFEAYESCVKEHLPEGFFVRLDVLFDKYLDSMNSTLDAVKLAKAIFEALKEAEKEANQQQDSDPSECDEAGDGDSQSESDQSNDSDTDDSSNDGSGGAESDADADQEDEQGGGSDADTGSNEGDDAQSSMDDSDSDPGSASPDEHDDQPQPSDESDSGKGAGDFSPISDACANADAEVTDIGDMVSESLEAQSREEDPNNDGYSDVIRVGGKDDSSGIQFTDAESLSKGILASGALRAQIVDILQAEADATRTLRDYGSRFETRRIARAMAGETRVWKHKTQGEVIDTSVHVLIDRSGSMGGVQHIANSAAVALALAIAAVPDADIAVSAFPAGHEPVATLLKRGNPVRPVMNRMAVTSSGGTPMVEAMVHAISELAYSLRERKVCLIVTDGAPANSEAVKRLVRMAGDEIDFYAIGIGCSAVEGLFKHTAVISDVSELKAQLFKMAQQFLTTRH